MSLADFEIVVCTGQRAGATVRVPPEGIEVGRRDGAGLQLPDPEVSHQHARLLPDEDSLRIEDLGSRNGTFVSGERVKTARVQPGDIVAFGTTLVEVRAARAEEVLGGPRATIVMGSAPVLGQVVAESVEPDRRAAVLAGLYHLGVAVVTNETPRRILSYGKQLFRDTFHADVRHEAALDVGGAAARLPTDGAGRVMQVPLTHGERSIGTLVLTLEGRAARFETRALAVADALGAHVAGALASVLIREEMESSRRQLASQLNVQSRALDRAQHSLQRAERRVVEAERMAAIAQLAAAVAHEVNNPLAFLTSSLEALGARIDERGDAEEREVLAECREGTKRIQGFVRRLQVLWEMGAAPTSSILLRALVADTLRTIRRESGDQVPIDAMLDAPDAALEGSAAGLVQVVRNLVANMLQAVEDADGPRGRVWVTLGAAEPESVELVVGGTAPPIALADRASVFQPFSTGGTAGPGLGLWMSQQIVADHGGTIRYEEMGEGGAGFVVRLPASGPGLDMTSEVTAA